MNVCKNINFSLSLISPAWMIEFEGISWNLLRCSFLDPFVSLRRQNRNSIYRHAFGDIKGNHDKDARGMFPHRVITIIEGLVPRVFLDWFGSDRSDCTHLISVARRASALRWQWEEKWQEGLFVLCSCFFLGLNCCWGRIFFRRWCREPKPHILLLLKSWWWLSFDRGAAEWNSRHDLGARFSSTSSLFRTVVPRVHL